MGKRQSFTREFKLEAVRLLRSSGRPQRQGFSRSRPAAGWSGLPCFPPPHKTSEASRKQQPGRGFGPR